MRAKTVEQSPEHSPSSMKKQKNMTIMMITFAFLSLIMMSLPVSSFSICSTHSATTCNSSCSILCSPRQQDQAVCLQKKARIRTRKSRLPFTCFSKQRNDTNENREEEDDNNNKNSDDDFLLQQELEKVKVQKLGVDIEPLLSQEVSIEEAQQNAENEFLNAYKKARYEFHESKKEFGGVDGAIDELKRKWDEDEMKDKDKEEMNMDLDLDLEGDGEVLMDNYYDDDSREAFQ